MEQQQAAIEGGQEPADFMAPQAADAPAGASNSPASAARATRAGREWWRVEVSIGQSGTKGMRWT